MNWKTTFVLTMLFVVILSTSCKTTNEPDVTFLDVEIPLNKMNREFSIIADKNANDFKVGDSVLLFLFTESNLPIEIMPQDIRIFENRSNNWIELKNEELYPSNHVISLIENPDMIDMLPDELVYVFPSVSGSEKAHIVRIIIIGMSHDKNGQEGKKVGAYLDITLSP